MRIFVYLLYGLCSYTCLAQDPNMDLLRLTRRLPNTLEDKQIDQINSLQIDSDSSNQQRNQFRSINDGEKEREQEAPRKEVITYTIGGNVNDQTPRKQSISTVTVQLHLDDKLTDPIVERNEYENDSFADRQHIRKKDREMMNEDDMLSDTVGGSSNSDYRYVMPPDTFFRQQNLQNGYQQQLFDKSVQYTSTPGQQVQYVSSPASITITASGGGPISAVPEVVPQYHSRAIGNGNVQILAPPSQNYNNINQQTRLQYLSDVNQYPPINHLSSNYISTLAPNVAKISSQQQMLNYLNQQGQRSNYHFVSTPQPQIASTPSPISQFLSQISQHKALESVNNFISTPAPNGIHASVTPNNVYVSTPMTFVSTPAPIQYSTGTSVFGSRLNAYTNQLSNKAEKQMQIDHFDNAISGVRNPKYPPGELHGNIQVSTTPSPVILSSTISPQTHEKERRLPIFGQNNMHLSQQMSHYQLQPTPVNIVQSPQNSNQYQSQSASHNSYQTVNDNNLKSQAKALYSYPPQSNSPMTSYVSLSTQTSNVNHPSPSPSTVTSNNLSQNPSFSNYQLQEMRNQNKIANEYQYQQNFQKLLQSQSNNIRPQQNFNQNQNIQRETLFSNEVSAANNMLNSLNQNYIGDKQQQTYKNPFQRDVSKDTDYVSTNTFSNNYGWNTESSKRGSIEIESDPRENNAGVYTFKSSPSDFTSTQKSAAKQVVEYRPYPDNPFLSHISFATSSPPQNTGSIQTINFQPDNNELQNVNVGYSIGFGNHKEPNRDNSKNTSPNQYSYVSNSPLPAANTNTALPTNDGDIIKGVQVSTVNAPEQVFLQKYTNEKNYPYNQNDLIQGPHSKQLSYSSASNQYSQDGSPKSSVGSKNSESVNSGKLYQYFINTPMTKSSNVQNSYNTYDEVKNQGQKWSSIIGAGVHVSTSPTNVEVVKQVVRESTSPNSILYLNQEGNENIDNRNYYYYSPQKENQPKIGESFDHEKALKNIQPIGISNAVSQSSLSTSNPVVTIPPQYIMEQPSLSNYQDFSQNIVQAPQNSFNIPQSLNFNTNNPYKMLKSYESNNNLQSYKPFDYHASESEIRSYIFKNPSAQSNNDLSDLHYKTQSADLNSQSTNVDTHHMDYIPSESFRGHKSSYNSEKNDLSQSQYNKISSNDFKNTKEDFQGPNELPNGKYGNKFYVNQNSGLQKTDFNALNNDQEYELISSSNQNNNFEPGKTKESKIMTIHGLKVANPYNMNLKVLSDLLQGKPVIDDSKLEKFNFDQIDLDTSMFRDMIARNEKVQELIPSEDYPHFEHFRSPRRKAVSSDITPVIDDIRGFQSSIESDSDQNDHNLRSHHMGAVIDQPIGFQPSQRSSDDSDDSELLLDDSNQLPLESDYVENQPEEKSVEPKNQNEPIVAVHHEKRPDSDRPYPLLQPPRFLTHRNIKKSDRHPLMSRPHYHHHSHHHHKNPKTMRDDGKDKKRSQKSAPMRPPPLLIIKRKAS